MYGSEPFLVFYSESTADWIKRHGHALEDNLIIYGVAGFPDCLRASSYNRL